MHSPRNLLCHLVQTANWWNLLNWLKYRAAPALTIQAKLLKTLQRVSTFHSGGQVAVCCCVFLGERIVADDRKKTVVMEESDAFHMKGVDHQIGCQLSHVTDAHGRLKKTVSFKILRLSNSQPQIFDSGGSSLVRVDQIQTLYFNLFSHKIVV